MTMRDAGVPVPPTVGIVGRRNSGKTTLLVAVAAELKRRGLRVGSVKHSHHAVEVDEPGKDSWRHYHEGGVEAVVLAAPGAVMFMGRAENTGSDPASLVERFFTGSGLDVVLVESFRAAPHPKVEIFRRAVAHGPLSSEVDAGIAGSIVAVVTDAPEAIAGDRVVIPLSRDASHVHAVADLVIELIGAGRSVAAEDSHDSH